MEMLYYLDLMCRNKYNNQIPHPLETCTKIADALKNDLVFSKLG